jgi:hypothetical protein
MQFFNKSLCSHLLSYVAIRYFGYIAITYQANGIVDALSITLRAVASGPIGGITGFGIAALGTRAVNILPNALHIAHCTSKTDICTM